VAARTLADTYRAIPGVAFPDVDLHPSIHRVDLGPDAERGIGQYPPIEGARYPSFVAAVDTDGNEVGGIRMPDVAVPVATHTGWNPRHPTTGGAGQIVIMIGATIPFAATAAERQRTGDPRPSRAERYRDRDDYLARVRATAEEMAVTRYLLTEDIEMAVQIAADRYDYFVAAASD
jgi:hypothetical protein